MKFLILSAMNNEISSMINVLAGRHDSKYCQRTFFSGRLGCHDVVLGATGVGKVNCASVSQAAIMLFQPDYFLFVGTAGALNPELNIGDIVVGIETFQYDMDCSDIGVPIGVTPKDPKEWTVLSGNSIMLDACIGFNHPAGGKIINGRILCGDSTVGSIAKKEHLFKNYNGDVAEMEGYSAAHTAVLNKIPFLLVRIVSDRADSHVVLDYRKFILKASDVIGKFVVHILNNIEVVQN